MIFVSGIVNLYKITVHMQEEKKNVDARKRWIQLKANSHYITIVVAIWLIIVTHIKHILRKSDFSYNNCEIVKSYFRSVHERCDNH